MLPQPASAAAAASKTNLVSMAILPKMAVREGCGARFGVGRSRRCEPEL
jgi:hypothetical protein